MQTMTYSRALGVSSAFVYILLLASAGVLTRDMHYLALIILVIGLNLLTSAK